MASCIQQSLKDTLSISRDAQILDIGCGYGFTMRALRNMGFKNIQGLEMSAQQARRSEAAGFHVNVAEDTTLWLAQHPAQFDLIVLFDVLEHLPVTDQIRFLAAIRNCLKPGGQLKLTVPNANSILSSRWRYIDYTHYSSFTEHSLYFVLKSASFDTIEMSNAKGLGRLSLRLWMKDRRDALKKWLVRWCWLQVFKAELPSENLSEISFELNLAATARVHK